MESLNFGSAKTRAKIIGTIISVLGALVTILFKGPVIFSPEFQASLSLVRTSNPNWIAGCVLLVASCIFCSLAFIVQVFNPCVLSRPRKYQIANKTIGLQLVRIFDCASQFTLVIISLINFPIVDIHQVTSFSKVFSYNTSLFILILRTHHFLCAFFLFCSYFKSSYSLKIGVAFKTHRR